jgi:RNA polymerase sigma-70 factor, ECF subfamily
MPPLSTVAAPPPWPTEEDVCAALTPRIRAYGLRHLASTAAAEDLVQDVLALIIEALRAGKIAAPAALPAYALSVSRNLVRDRIRTSHRRAALVGAFETGAGVARLPAWEIEPGDLDRVGRCLGHLSRRDREVLVRSFIHEEDARQIAANLGIAVGHLRVIRHRALARLRELLETSQSSRESSP